jgi:uncharacterized membrane protein YebE (DUF533 family)
MVYAIVAGVVAVAVIAIVAYRNWMKHNPKKQAAVAAAEKKAKEVIDVIKK